MMTLQSRESIFDYLEKIAPAHGILVSGCRRSDWAIQLGGSQAPQRVWLQPDPAQGGRLPGIAPTSGVDEWTAHAAVLAPADGPVTYYQASLRAESGLLQPEALRSLWPNVATTAETEREAVSYASLIQTLGFRPNWLVIDQFPALPLLQSMLDVEASAIDVLIVRAVRSEQADVVAAGLGLAEVSQYVQQHGFVAVDFQPDRHPSIVYAFFVRDFRQAAERGAVSSRQQLAAQSEELQALARQNQDFQKRIQQAESARVQAEQRVTHLDQALKSTTAQSQSLEKELAAREAEHAKQREQLQALPQLLEEQKSARGKADELAARHAADLKAQLTRTHELERKLTAAQDEVGQLRESAKAQSEQLKALDAARAKAVELAAQREDAVRSADTSRQAAEAKFKALAADLAQHQEAAKDWPQKLAALQSANKDEQGRRAKSDERVKQLEAEREATLRQRQAFEQQLKTLQAEQARDGEGRTALAKQLEQAQTALKDEQARRAQAEDRVKQLEAARESAASKQSALEQRLQPLETERAQLLASRDAHAQQLSTVQETLKREQAQRGESQKKLEAVQVEHQALIKRRDELKQQVAQLEASLKAERERAAAQDDQQEKELLTLQTARSELDKQLKAVRGERDGLKQDLLEVARGRDAQAKLAAERGVKLQKLEAAQKQADSAARSAELAARSAEIQAQQIERLQVWQESLSQRITQDVAQLLSTHVTAQGQAVAAAQDAALREIRATLSHLPLASAPPPAARAKAASTPAATPAAGKAGATVKPVPPDKKVKNPAPASAKAKSARKT